MSSVLEVNVKWGKEAVTISFAPDQGVKALKAELEEKTGVPADRMKIMPKSKGAFYYHCGLQGMLELHLLVFLVPCSLSKRK